MSWFRAWRGAARPAEGGFDPAFARLPRRAALATRHGKERWLGPPLAALGLEVVEVDVDTDAFGTFSGERPRVGTARDTVLAKARAALERDPTAGWGVASEGTFQAHPDASWIGVDEEVVALVARDGAVEVVGKARALTTLAQRRITRVEACAEAAAEWGFPEQGILVVADHGGEPAPERGVEKEARTLGAIEAAVRAVGLPAWLVPDLRAHRCPSRVSVIAAAAADAAARARVDCPRCGCAGFGPEGVVPGRRCADCGRETDQPLTTIHRCAACGAEARAPIPGPPADPATCAACNP